MPTRFPFRTPVTARASKALAAACVLSLGAAGGAGIAAAEGAPHHPGPVAFGAPAGVRHGWLLQGVVVADPAPSATQFSVQVPGCSSPVTIAVTGATRIVEPGVPGALTSVPPGAPVVVSLLRGAPTPTARTVTVLLEHLAGVVQSVSSSSFVLVDGQGFDRTVDVTGATTYLPSGTTLGALTGMRVDAVGTPDANGTALDAVVVRARPATTTITTDRFPKVVAGIVSAAPAPTATGFTVTAQGGTPVAITTRPSTHLVDAGLPVRPSAVIPGEHVVVFLAAPVTSGSGTARTVVVILDRLDGRVVSSAGSSFVLADAQGFDRTVDVSAGTAYLPTGASFGSLAEGRQVSAYGTVDPDQVSLDAQAVVAHSGHVRLTAAGGPPGPRCFTTPPPTTVPSSTTTVAPTTTTTAAAVTASASPVQTGAGRPEHLVHVEGTVAAVDTQAGTVTVDGPHGGTVTVDVTPTTTYADGPNPATLQTVAGSIGAPVKVMGTAGPGSAVTALTVVLDPGSDMHGWQPGNGRGARDGAAVRTDGTGGSGPGWHAGDPRHAGTPGPRAGRGPAAGHGTPGGGFGH